MTTTTDQTIRTVIEGTPYCLTPNERGWQVTAMDTPTSRLYRSYQVTTGDHGEPLRCSCPSCHYQRRWCKHLRRVEEIRDNAPTRRSDAHRLYNAAEGVYRDYAPLEGEKGAVEVRTYHGWRLTSREEMSREEARASWSLALKSGYERV